ncbi:ciliogenesis and planar polarity effector 1, partial [Clarias magur]
IKRRKPWPRFCWLGKEREGVFLLDDNRISEINLHTGQTKKKIPKLQQVLPRVLTMSSSKDGMWLSGLLISGEVFLWNRDKESLKMISSVPAVYDLASSAKASSTRLSLLVSENGRRVLVASLTGQIFLWECIVPQDLNNFRDNTVKGRWSQVDPSEHSRLPSTKDKEACLHCVFVKSQSVGDVCLGAFIFTSGEQLMVTFLKIEWEETLKNSLKEYSINWVTKSYTLSQLVPPCRPVKSRGALVPAFSPDGKLLAIVLNQKDPRATQVLFISVQNFVTVSSSLGGCGSKKLSIPPKYVRSYWVSCVSWMPESLYLACILKRGSVLMLGRLAGLVSLSTSGCDIEFGPAHFLPLHPLITYSSSVSLRDPMRQRYSVTWHPRLPYLIVSDGYMVTVLNMPSCATSSKLMKSFLMEMTQALESARKIIHSELPQVKSRMASMSTLKFTASLLALKRKETSESPLPLFLRDVGSTGSSGLLTERFEDNDDDSDEGHGARSFMDDGGRLEFASMFDTLHAQSQVESEDSDGDSSALLEQLTRAQRSLLTAWAFCVSLDGEMDQSKRVMKYIISSAVRLAHLLRIAGPLIQPQKRDGVFEIFRSLLSFLPWYSLHKGGPSYLGIVSDLARQFVHLFLPSSSPTVCSSENFIAALFVIREASKVLDLTYSLPQKAVFQATDNHCPSDMFCIPLLQDDEYVKTISAQISRLNRPSNRLVAIWRDIYRQAVQYQDQLQSDKSLSSRNRELENLSKVISQIQKSLQGAGDHLEESPALYRITGEEHFISGEYNECIQVWREQLWEERMKAGPRTVFLETRYCLALLFGQLYQYRLREAQALCDTMAKQLLDSEDTLAMPVEGACFESWLPQQVNSEAACAVVQSLGRFMASYFTNQPLAILPPHNVDILPPLHLTQSTGRRTVALSQWQVAAAVRSQHLSGVWTVEYALELLLLGGLIPEATWLAQSLGDWKMAASLGLTYTTYCRLHYDFSRLKWRELHLPVELQPGFIFQTQLESLLACKVLSDRKNTTFKSLPDIVEVGDMELLHVSAQEILKASVMSEVDVVSQPLTKLLESAKELASLFTALVPPAFYLPAPPLYCPQPAPNTQDSISDILLALERESRCQVAAVVQRVLLLFRAAHCSRPAVQWYISSLRRCRRLFRKVKKGSVHPKDEFPEGLKKFTNRHGFFGLGSKDMDNVVIQTIASFRELCGLCWMLHVRDQLTVSCRRYQAARNKTKDSQVADNSVHELREGVLRWACRLMPFSRFFNGEETLQDLVLSLVAELPALPMVAEILVTVFPDKEESVRVPLREKYTSLLQRLISSTVQGSTSLQATQPSSTQEKEEGVTMALLIQEQRRQRVRQGRRLARSKMAPELYLWEREEEDERFGAKALFDRFSLCSSPSNSALADLEQPPVDSEADTADTLSEPHSPKLRDRPDYSSASPKPQNTFKSKDGGKRDGTRQEHKSYGLPCVGTWMFELEDEEYLCFLELFLSYVLEKDSLDTEESELPLLSSFSSCLRDRELHSDAFDMLTALKRRQAGRKKGVQLPVFRAGGCFQTLPETPEPLPSIGAPPSVLSENCTAQTNTGALPFSGKQPGLFSLRQQKALPLRQNVITQESSSVPNLNPGIPQMERCKTISCPDVDLQLELDSKLEAEFPQLARLLEWMLRWADRSVLLTHSSKKMAGGGGDPVVIRAKASAPAVLSALRLLEKRCTKALLRTDKQYTQIRVPEREAQAALAPVMPQELGWKRERESSVDTGYPSASGGTPITLPDLDPQHGRTSEPCEGEEFQDELSLSHLCGHEDTISDLELNGPSVGRVNEPLIVAELNSDRSSVETLEESSFEPNISVQIKTKSETLRPRDQTLTLADLENSKTSDDSCESHSTDIGSLGIEHAEPKREPENSPVCEASKPVQRRKQQLPTMSNPLPEPANVSHSQTAQNGENIPPGPVRQLLQDELFRLVQLQQINFMSLMQVVGSSFANLPLSHGNPLLSQPSVPAAQPVQPQAQPTVPQSSEPPSHTTQNTRLENKPDTISELQNRKSRAADQKWVEANSALNNPEEMSRPNSQPQELRQLTIRPDWSQNNQEERSHFIPPSQGLLTTMNIQATLQGNQQNCPLEKTVPFIPGLKLLRLPPPQSPPAQIREAWGPNQTKSTMYRSSENYMGRAEPTTQPLHRNLNQYNTQTQSYTSSERGRERDAVRLPPAHSMSNMRLPLLRLPTDTQVRHVQLPQIQLPMRLETAGTFSEPQLLHVESDSSRNGFRYSTPPLPIPRLIPLEELMAWAAGNKQEVNSKLRLLKADIKMQSKLAATPSSKRLKRREDKKKEEKVVSFRPDDSIIPPSQEPKEDKSPPDDGYVIPLGSFESMLTGQRLLAEAHVTSAELHAFAATHKRPPEIQDACTNTDPASPCSTTDKVVSAQLPLRQSPSACAGHEDINVAPSVSPEVCLNINSTEEMVPDKAHTSAQEIISVSDLEGDSVTQTPVQRQSLSPPTSAQLHLLSASVVNSTETGTETHTNESPGYSVTFTPPALVLSVPEPTGDPVTEKMLTEFETQHQVMSAGPLADRAFSRKQVSAHLSEMDARLAALQSIADQMDKEFANTRLLVNTIDALRPVMTASVEEEPHSSMQKITKEAKRRTTRVIVNEEEEQQGEKRFLTSTPKGVLPCVWRGHSSLDSTSLSTQNMVQQGHITPTVKSDQPIRELSQEELTGSLMENSGLLDENILGLSGLSDVADILGDLVKKGALSPSAFQHSPSVTGARSKPEEQQKRAMMEEERKELRTWMRRKQRESLVEYHKQRQEKKERERVPFTPPKQTNLSSRDLAINRKVKEERNRAALLEHHSQRAHEACSLITDMLSTPLVLPAPSNSTTKTKTQDSRPGSRTQVKGSLRKSPKSQRGRARSVSSFGKTVVLQKRGASAQPATLSSKFGLHRPVSSLPGDRLSQVTRRGMLTDLRGRPRPQTTIQCPKSGLNKSSVELKTVRELEESMLEDEEERDVVSPWDVPLEIRRILALDNRVKSQGLVENDDDWMEALSESTGSILEKKGDEEDVSSIMGFSGFGRKARTFDLEAIFEQTRRTAIERSQRALEDRQQQESQISGPSAASSSQKQRASASTSRQKESDDSSDSSDSEPIGPPAPPSQADDEEDEPIGPPLPPGFSRTAADDDEEEDDDTMEEEEDEDPVKKIPDTHEITLQHGTKTVSALALDPSGARLVTGGYDFDVKFWDFAGMDAALQAFRSLQPCECHQIKSLQYSITGDVILVVAGNSQAKVLDRDGFQVLECIKGDQYIVDMANTKGHTAMLNSGCWHPKIKEEFLTCSNDGTVRTWDLNNEKKHKSVFKPRSMQGKRVTPTCCTYSRDGKLIAAGCQDGTIQIWDRNLS